MTSLHRVKVLDREVQVRSTASVEEVREVETFVNDTISALQASMKTTDLQILAIMALLNIAESFLLQSQECSRMEQVVQEKVSRLTQHIDDAVRQE
ncbi:MAG: cell division protein ZapA [Geobacteraceae bacterium]|nr:cell division protein ZapA [Geobacteraceae bacterium]